MRMFRAVAMIGLCLLAGGALLSCTALLNYLDTFIKGDTSTEKNPGK